VGGVLTAVVFTASTESTAMEGLGLLLVFGIAMTTPFMIAALFALPTLQRLGLGFNTAFWLISAVELATALGIIYFIFNLHEEHE
jgi:cytochrome c biogenesis protein CcdA